MNRKGEIEKYDDTRCIECGKQIYSTDDYYAIKPNKLGAVKFRSSWIHIHKVCYEKLLTKNKSKKEVIL